MTYCPNLAFFRLKNICFKRNQSHGRLRCTTLQTKEGRTCSEFNIDRLANSETPSTSLDDPVIIERSIEPVLGPFIAFHRSFLEYCTLTNKTVKAT